MTAAESYAKNAAEIAAQLKTLEKKLARHAAAAKREPKDWGFTGDLSHLRIQLQQMNAFFKP